MSRYAIRPKASTPRADYYYDDPPLLPQLTVDENAAVDTGLVDANGDTIMRLPLPVGFGRCSEW